MLAFALALSFLGLLILAALHPDTTRSYLDGMFGGGAFRGLALLALNLLALPNLCVWLLVPAMGSCVGGHVSYGGASYSSCLVSYGHVATRAALRGIETLGPFATDPRQLPAPSPGYLGFMGIPVVAALLGGYVAARRASPPTRSAASGAGVLAGAGFGLLVTAASLLAALVIQVHGVPGLEGGGRPIGTATLWVGPAPLQGGLVGAAWGVLGEPWVGCWRPGEGTSRQSGSIPASGEGEGRMGVTPKGKGAPTHSPDSCRYQGYDHHQTSHRG